MSSMRWAGRRGGAAAHGRTSHGMHTERPSRVEFTGSQSMWRKPLATLAVMDPRALVARSRMSVARPSGVSCSDALMVSPGFISKASVVGVNVASVCWSGPGGPTGTPLWVRKAKLCPVTGQFRRVSRRVELKLHEGRARVMGSRRHLNVGVAVGPADLRALRVALVVAEREAEPEGRREFEFVRAAAEGRRGGCRRVDRQDHLVGHAIG
jgi:hypothetical protein